MDDNNLGGGLTVSGQLRVLRTILAMVRKMRAVHERVVVEIDLDLSALMPIERTREALRVTGRRLGIDLFTRPERLPVLPGYSDEAWMAFVKMMDLPSAYPQVAWRDSQGGPDRAAAGPFALFHDAYWNVALMADDAPTPGLGSFCHRVREEGGDVVFLSGRWLPEHVEPSRRALRRAGIPDPYLIIGNPWHPTLVSADQALSDAGIKAAKQREILRDYGQPVAIVDDRAANRDAVIAKTGSRTLGVGVCLPGFTHDPAADAVRLKTSTFELYDDTLDTPPIRVYMVRRHGPRGPGEPWRGLYEGLGANELPYVLPRFTDAKCAAGRSRPFEALVAHHAPGSLEESELVALCLPLLPSEAGATVDRCLADAKLAAASGLAAPYPTEPDSCSALRDGLLASWLHSRDLEEVMTAIGYPIVAAGVHDLVEEVPVEDVAASVAGRAKGGVEQEEWVGRYVLTLPPGGRVNVGCLNPALAVGMWRWEPDVAALGAMDIHRAATHHSGDGGERYDPIEAAVNNLLHQREGRLGIRKEPVCSWAALRDASARESGAEMLAKSSLGRNVLRDALDAAAHLESAGSLTPWALVKGASFD